MAIPRNLFLLRTTRIQIQISVVIINPDGNIPNSTPLAIVQDNPSQFFIITREYGYENQRHHASTFFLIQYFDCTYSLAIGRGNPSQFYFGRRGYGYEDRFWPVFTRRLDCSSVLASTDQVPPNYLLPFSCRNVSIVASAGSVFAGYRQLGDNDTIYYSVSLSGLEAVTPLYYTTGHRPWQSLANFYRQGYGH